MSEEELDAAGALAVDEDQDELMEEMSIEERQERLKKARWNVFLYLGVAAILFGFALFPMPFSADWDEFSTSAEKDVGLVGLPVDGEDLFDVPMRLTRRRTTAHTGRINIAVYVIEQEDCTDFTLSEKMQEAKQGDSHAYQYQEADTRVLADGTYDFEFNIDPGHYCLIAEYIDANGDKITSSGNALSVEGKLYPNQFLGGFPGLLCLALSAFAFVGAQSTALRSGRFSKAKTRPQNPRCSPKPARPALLPAPVAPRPQVLLVLPALHRRSRPDRPVHPVPHPPKHLSQNCSCTGRRTNPAAGSEGTFEPAENGYFFKKFADGTYDQTVYVQNAEGAYVPHEG